jgi:hypothetical protein
MAASFLFKVVIARLNHGVWEVLVHWLGRSATDTSWEQLEEFKIRYFRRSHHTTKGRPPKMARNQPHEDK